MTEDKGLIEITGRMSERLRTVANMLGGVSDDLSCNARGVSFGTLDSYRTVADVGCDHGYVSIYLVKKNIAKNAIAMDIRKGPLEMAKSNIEGFGLKESIETRLSDGLTELHPGEADSLVIAGMGGKLMISILEKKDLQDLGIRTAVLQPQSDIPEFRGYLRSKGYYIEDERIVLEDGKYYFPMRVLIRPSDIPEEVYKLFSRESKEDVLRICNRYGEHNILRRDPLLKAYLEHGLEVARSIQGTLDAAVHERRARELSEEISDIELVLKVFG